MLKKLIPDYYFKSVYDIPYEELYNSGIRLILTDLDNTLISYNEYLPDGNLFELKRHIESLGFEFILVSNSKKERVTRFASAFRIPCVTFATKPLKRGIKKAINKVAKNKYNNNQILLIGDQLMTDVFGAKRCKIKVGLIEPIDKSSDIKTTSFNRKLEKHFIKKIQKKYPKDYERVLKEFNHD